MLAGVVLVYQGLLHGPEGRVEDHRVPVYECYLLHDDSIVHRVHGVRAPGKGAVRIDQHAGSGGRIARSAKVSTITLPVFFSYSPRISASVMGRVRGDFAVEIIRLRRPHGWSPRPRLGEKWWPSGSECGRCRRTLKKPCTAPHGWACRWRASTCPRRPCRPDRRDHILDRHPLIGYARGLDDHKAVSRSIPETVLDVKVTRPYLGRKGDSPHRLRVSVLPASQITSIAAFSTQAALSFGSEKH